jgi:hypothetical protein
MDENIPLELIEQMEMEAQIENDDEAIETGEKTSLDLIDFEE